MNLRIRANVPKCIVRSVVDQMMWEEATRKMGKWGKNNRERSWMDETDQND